MRPPPEVLMFASAGEHELDELLSANASVYVVALREPDGRLTPINLRRRSLLGDGQHYSRTQFAHPGFAWVLAERLAKRFQADIVVAELPARFGKVLPRPSR